MLVGATARGGVVAPVLLVKGVGVWTGPALEGVPVAGPESAVLEPPVVDGRDVIGKGDRGIGRPSAVSRQFPVGEVKREMGVLKTTVSLFPWMI